MWCNVTLCDTMWRDLMWCDVMWCDVMSCDVMWYDGKNLLHPLGYRQKKRTDDNAAQPSGREFSTRCMRSPSQKSSYQGECLANSCKFSSVAANGDKHNIMASASVGFKKLKLMCEVGSDRYGLTSSGTSNRCWTYIQHIISHFWTSYHIYFTLLSLL